MIRKICDRCKKDITGQPDQLPLSRIGCYSLMVPSINGGHLCAPCIIELLNEWRPPVPRADEAGNA